MGCSSEEIQGFGLKELEIAHPAVVDLESDLLGLGFILAQIAKPAAFVCKSEIRLGELGMFQFPVQFMFPPGFWIHVLEESASGRKHDAGVEFHPAIRAGFLVDGADDAWMAALAYGQFERISNIPDLEIQDARRARLWDPLFTFLVEFVFVHGGIVHEIHIPDDQFPLTFGLVEDGEWIAAFLRRLGGGCGNGIHLKIPNSRYEMGNVNLTNLSWVY
jgi:hypothetical protein